MQKNPIIVTGATGSIGFEVTRELAAQGKPVLMACRNTKRAEQLRAEILENYPEAKIDVLALDLDRIESIAGFCKELERNNVNPVGLLNNAGVMCRSFKQTADGFERSVGVNYIGTYLLTRLLEPQMASGGVIVNTVSISRVISSVDKSFFEIKEKDFGQIKSYAKSKLALMLFTAKLAQVSKHKIVATDPGIVDSNMITMGRWFDPLANVLFRPLCNTPKQGAIPALNALNTDRSGLLFNGKRYKEIPKKYFNHPYIDWLWEETEKILRAKEIDF